MPYLTIKQPPIIKQITLEEILSGEILNLESYNRSNTANTRTVCVSDINSKLLEKINLQDITDQLAAFVKKYDYLIKADKNQLYISYFIPKRSGGVRRIDDPVLELREAQNELKKIFETFMFATYHTSAFAYVKNRCTIDAVKKHQQNVSKWFAKTDFSNFFGNTTKEFVFDMISQQFPFSEIIKNKFGKEKLYDALDVCFLNGGLPQGSTISPLITNIMMIPIDHYLFNTFSEYIYEDGKKQHFVYTRYADDIIISSKKPFEIETIVDTIEWALNHYNAPFKLNSKKTRYGSSSGRNWNLGVMLNQENHITIGHQRKKQFKAMLSNYITSKLNNTPWNLEDVQVLSGLINYYLSVEREAIKHIIDQYDKKYNVNIYKLINKDLKTL